MWFVYKEDVTESREKIIDPTFGKAHTPIMCTVSVWLERKM